MTAVRRMPRSGAVEIGASSDDIVEFMGVKATLYHPRHSNIAVRLDRRRGSKGYCATGWWVQL